MLHLRPGSLEGCASLHSASSLDLDHFFYNSLERGDYSTQEYGYTLRLLCVDMFAQDVLSREMIHSDQHVSPLMGQSFRVNDNALRETLAKDGLEWKTLR